MRYTVNKIAQLACNVTVQKYVSGCHFTIQSYHCQKFELVEVTSHVFTHEAKIASISGMLLESLIAF